jgi:hypothetical protein
LRVTDEEDVLRMVTIMNCLEFAEFHIGIRKFLKTNYFIENNREGLLKDLPEVSILPRRHSIVAHLSANNSGIHVIEFVITNCTNLENVSVES